MSDSALWKCSVPSCRQLAIVTMDTQSHAARLGHLRKKVTSDRMIHRYKAKIHTMIQVKIG